MTPGEPTHDLSFGIQASGQFPDGLPPPTFFRDLAQTAEELGYDSLWSGDHLSFLHPIHEIVVMSSFLAAWTRRLTIGFGVLLLPLRHPTLVAKQLASLDELCGGRTILGVGLGGEGPGDFAAVGIPVSERASRTDEGITALRRLWSGQPANHAGHHYAFEDVRIVPQPRQAGGPPIWIGGRSDAALDRVARSGDGWMSYMVSPERFRRSRDRILSMNRSEPGSPRGVTFSALLPTFVDTDLGRARRTAIEHLSTRYGQAFPEHAVERYCVVGDPGTCRDQIQRFVDAGASHLVFAPVGDPAETIDQITLLRSEVLPEIRPPQPPPS